MIKTRVLVIEDTADLCYELVDYLRFSGYDAHGVGSVAGMRQCLEQESWQVLVLDLGLPDGDATVAAQQIRHELHSTVDVFGAEIHPGRK